MRLYVDSAPVIYFVQKVVPYRFLVERWFQRPDIQLIFSDLTRLECLVLPLREGNRTLQSDFDAYFSTLTEIQGLTRTVLRHASEIRAVYNFSTPDAIHLAAAQAAGCDVFLTNDRRLLQYEALKIERVEASTA